MPPRSKIDLLPDDVRAELDRKLLGAGFGSYVELAAWLTERGHAIGKSAVGEYGKALQERLDSIRASTDAARQIAQAAPDDADERSNAIISLLQAEIFETLIVLQSAAKEADSTKRIAMLGSVAKNIATLTRASVTRNKWAVEVRQKVDAAIAAASKIASRGGLSADAVSEIRSAILGIAQ